VHAVALPRRVIATSGDGGFHVSETEILKKKERGGGGLRMIINGISSSTYLCKMLLYALGVI
jgi:hypothetical protein